MKNSNHVVRSKKFEMIVLYRLVSPLYHSCSNKKLFQIEASKDLMT